MALKQKIPSTIGKSAEPLSKGCYKLDLEYSPITKETETSVGGKVSDEKGQPPKNGFSLELSRRDQG